MLQIFILNVVFGVPLIPKERAHGLLGRKGVPLFPLLLHLFVLDGLGSGFAFYQQKSNCEIIDHFNSAFLNIDCKE